MTATISGDDGVRRCCLEEPAAKALLGNFGIATPRGVRISNVDTDLGQLKSLACPLAVKLISPDVQHKSDGGYVGLRVDGRDQVVTEIRRMTELAEERGHAVGGFLVEEMVEPGLEVVVGGFVDPCFGPAVMFGFGGVFVEVLSDVSFAICPVSRGDAHDLICQLTGLALLGGARGGVPTDRETLVDLILKVGGDQGAMMSNRDRIIEVDLNPVIVHGRTAIAVDALVVLETEAVCG